mmetsp:Transcript_66620/g.124336  ORF Transcript_66620/g.124336 Transcript_66620/m.124336 type:complete len:319 (+) Transcript_66620:144-1100(+)
MDTQADAAEVEGFDPGHFSVENREYGIFILLACRTQMPEQEAAPAEVATLKFVESRVIENSQQRSAPRQSHNKPAPSDDEDGEDELVSEGEPQELTEQAPWPGKKGSWWKVLSSLGEDVIVREGVSVQSKEVQRVRPGDIVQQAGQARILVRGRAKGCVRVPVQPTGWVTADAQKAGGPKYLVRTETPRWQAVYGSGGVIMREESALDSDEVHLLQCGAIVEQAGPCITRPDGIIRMPVIAQVTCRRPPSSLDDSDESDTSSIEVDEHYVAKTMGWVTIDATEAGGPLYFKPAPPAPTPAKNNHNHHNNKKKWQRQSD